MPNSKITLPFPTQANEQYQLAEAGNEKLIADVEQFLYYHRSADLTAEVLQVRLLLAILDLLGSPKRSSSVEELRPCRARKSFDYASARTNSALQRGDKAVIYSTDLTDVALRVLAASKHNLSPDVGDLQILKSNAQPDETALSTDDLAGEIILRESIKRRTARSIL